MLTKTDSCSLPNNEDDASSLTSGEDIYQKMIENVEDYAILLIDKNGVVQNWNKGAEKIKGYTAAEIIGQNFRVFYRAEDRKARLPEKLLKEAQKKGHAVHEGWRLKKDGSCFWGSVAITSIYNAHHEIVGFTKVTRDLTGRKKVSEKIREAVAEAQEKERMELAETLHSNVAQILAAGVLSAKLVEKTCPGEHIVFVKQYLQEAMEEIRKLSHNLNPVAELNTGLSNAIELLITDLNKLSKTQFRFKELGKPLKISEKIKKLLYRTTQELVNNILKYSEAKDAEVTVNWREKEVVLLVQDNGKGFDTRTVRKGLGLENMNYRLQMYNGKASIVSAPGAGSSIYIKVPL